jgi:hypothetical protein
MEYSGGIHEVEMEFGGGGIHEVEAEFGGGVMIDNIVEGQPLSPKSQSSLDSSSGSQKRVKTSVISLANPSHVI